VDITVQMSYLTLHEDLPTQIAVSSLMVFDKVPYDVLLHNSHHAFGLVALHYISQIIANH